jgi:hypothetical protein
MAQENIKDITLTAAGGTFMFDLFGTSQNVLEIGSSGTITLAANVVINRNIPPMGTLTDTYVKIRWTANVIPNGNTVTILGNVVNEDLLDKDFVMDCYHSPLGWKIKYLVDYASLVTNIGKHDIIATDGDSSSVSTANLAGAQTLRTLTYNKQLFRSDGDKVKVVVSGNFAANAHSKNVTVVLSDGTVAVNLFNSSGAFQGNFIYEGEFIASDISAGKWKYRLFQNTSSGDVRMSTSSSALPTFDYTSTTWSFTCEGTEGTPTGNEITIYSFDVELIKV